MATKYVITGSTDLSAAASYDGAALPSAGDEVHIRDGSQTITVGLTGVALNRLRVGPGFQGRIGTAASGVAFRVDNGSGPKLELEGWQYANIQAHTTGGITKTICNAPIEVNISGTGTTATLVVKRGTVNIGSGAVVTNIYQSGGDIDAEANGTAFTLVSIGGGTTRSKRNWTTATVDGRGVLIGLVDAAGTTTNVNGLATFNPQGTGTMTTVNANGQSTTTPAGARQDVTVTTLNITGNATVFSQNGQSRLVIGTTNDQTERGTRITDSIPPFGGEP
jgi:hypothetical protein